MRQGTVSGVVDERLRNAFGGASGADDGRTGQDDHRLHIAKRGHAENTLARQRVDNVPLQQAQVVLANDLPANELIQRAAGHLVLADGAKRARVWLTEQFADIVGLGARPAADLAVAVELIHSASLLHDDVIDESDARRGRPSVNRLYGNATAVLTGDYLFAEAFRALLPLPPAVMRAALGAITQMTRAALDENLLTGRLDLTVAQWESVARGKTGALFALSGEGAALAAGREDLAAPLARFGHELGLCFQMLDDLADLLGADGKPRWQDLHNRVPALPTALALAHPLVESAMLEVLQDDDVIEESRYLALTHLMARAGIPAEVARRARLSADAATAALLSLPPSRTRDELAEVATSWIASAWPDREAL